MDGGVSTFAHRKLRELVKTPLLQTEHIRLPEQHMNFILADGTDYVRVGAHEDGGITGAMKIFHACESVGLDVETHGPDPGAPTSNVGGTKHQLLRDWDWFTPTSKQTSRRSGSTTPTT